MQAHDEETDRQWLQRMAHWLTGEALPAIVSHEDAVLAVKSSAVKAFMDCAPEDEAALADLITEPAGIRLTSPKQGRLPL